MQTPLELNPVRWSQDERQEFLDKGFRSRRAGEIPCSAFVRPGDYDNDLKRGELEFMVFWRNYSFHTVTIPDGAEIHDTNFAQASPRTDAIRGKNLRLIGCNLVNCLIDPSWYVDPTCNTAQRWLIYAPDGSEKSLYLCDHPDKAAGAKAPANAVLAREY